MFPFALVILRRPWVFAFSLILLFVPCLKDDPSRVLVAVEAVGLTRSASAKLPLSFEPNLGQADPRVKFLSRGPGYTLFLTEDEAALVMQKPEVRSQKLEVRRAGVRRAVTSEEGEPKESGVRSQESGKRWRLGAGDSLSSSPWPPAPSRCFSADCLLPTAFLSSPARRPQSQPPSFLDLKLLRANPAAKLTGLDELPGKSNYLIGNDPKKWRTNVPTYARVRYENVYPGVDLDYYGNQGGQLEYDFVVAPGADPRQITLAVGSDRQREGSRQKAVGSSRSSVVRRQWSEVGHNGPRTADEVGNSGHVISQSKIQNRKSKIASSLHIAPNGDLIVALPGGEVRFHKPLVYQAESIVDSRQSTVESRAAKGESRQSFPRGGIGGPLQSPTETRQRTTDHGQLTSANPKSKIQNLKLRERTTDYRPLTSANPKSEIQNLKSVDGRYVLKSDGEVSFEIAPYDRTLPLIIDPVLSYSTYLGGSDMDYANAIAVDASGNAYVTGYTASTDFPLVNPAQGSPGGGTCTEDGVDTVPCFDAFVSKLNSTGTALLYSTYLGGSNEDYGAGIAVDASGHAYVAGYTYSTDFPVQNALQSENAGGWDAFVTELSADGASLIYSTYWGGSLDDIGTGIAVDSSGNAYLSGYTDSTDFPVSSGALQANYGGGAHNGFVVKLNSGGAQLGYSTFLGGSGDDYAYAAAVDSAGDAYVTGATNSTNFPTLKAFQPNYAGGLCAVAPNTFPCYDAFVTKLNPAGSALIFSTYLGGTGSDYGYAIALDSSANAYVTGYTTSKNFPTTPGAFEQVYGGSYDVFVAKLNGAGSTLGYSTYLGGSGTQVAYGIAVDSAGCAFVTGYNYGGNFPTANPVQAQNAGFYDAFVSVLDPTGSFLIFSTYLGGTQDDFGRGISLDPSGNAYVTGATFSLDFPTTSGSFQPSYTGGPYDAFVTKYTAPAVPLVALSPSSYDFGSQVVGTTSSPETIALTNTGNAALTISSITASGDFSQTNTCGSSVAASASCTLSVTFTPTATGSRSGSITITDNASPATQTISLTGTGTAPVVSLSPASLTFPAQAVGTSSSAQSVTLSNTGSATLSITSITASGDFSQTNTCGSSVAASANCTLSVTFTPTAAGSRSGSITITDNASPATQTVSLTGTGTAPVVSLSSASLTFPAQAVGTSSSAQSVTLSNTGSATLSITSITATGDFSQTNTCGSSVAASANCTLSVTFTPTAAGSRSGSITITDNASPATQTISLTGTGTAPVVSLSSASLTFPAQAVGTSSSAQSVTLSNTGSATLSITSITATGNFSQTNTCGSSLAPNASCTISVTFTPTATGSCSGSITITDNDPATQTVSLTGTGTAPVVSLSSASLTFPAQAVGTSSSAQSVTLSNTGSATLSITSITATGDFSQTNTCGSSVAASASCTLSVTFKPTAAGTRTGAVTIADNASPATQTVSLTGTGTAPVVSLSPTSLTFPAQPVGTSSSAQSLTLRNTGNATLSITSITASGDFSQTNTCGSSVAASASCTLSVTFKPTAAGTRTGAVTIADNASPATQTVSLTGTGTAPVVSLSPTSLTFPAQAVGSSSSAQSVTLSNTGSATLSIASITASGDFSQTNTCGSSVVASASCTLSVTFKPMATGTRTGAVTIADNASPATQTVSLTGTGVVGPAVSLSPASLTFPAQAVGTSSSAQSVTLKNTGNATLSITSIKTSGDFSQTNTCGSRVATGGSCTIRVTFKPTAAGTRTGTVTVTDNSSPATQTVSLTGTGTAPVVSLSPASLTFPAQAVGTSSNAQSVTLSNTGNATLSITSIKTSGDFSQTNTCGSSVAAGASCTIRVTFKPTATGTRTGAVTITDNASPATQTVSLTGTGVAAPVVSLSPASLTFPTQAVGTSSRAQSVTLKNTGNATLSITSIKTSGDFSQTNTCGSSVAAGASCTIRVTFKPTATGTRTGAVTITDNASPATQTVGLTGTGGAAPTVSFSPASLTFSAQLVGASSSPQSLTLTNTGSATLSITSITASGDSSQTNTCGSSVAANASCTLSVTFKPTAAGTRTGAVTITDNAAGSPQTVALTGTGEDFIFTAPPGSATSATVSPGGTATYMLSVVAVGGFNQDMTFTCTGAPSEAGCTVSPASVTLSSSSTNVTVTVSTTAPSLGMQRHNPLPPIRPARPQPWLLWTMALAASGSLAWATPRWVRRRVGRSRAAFVTFAALLLVMVAMAACGGGGGGGDAPPQGNPGSPPGTYTLTATGTCSSGSTSLSQSVNLTLQVQ